MRAGTQYMKYLKMLAFALVAFFAVNLAQAAVIYSDSSSGTTTEVMYVSEAGNPFGAFFEIQAGASYTFVCEAHDSGYAEWTISVTDTSGTYTCHAWRTKGVFMSDGCDTYWAVLGCEPEIFYFYYNYVMENPPPPPEW